ncbi:hypothetical protein CPB85DRAFT_1436180 [Mucidula mucida]|nr:hypothetical protein CPB85DRAFT_1436180 [Mucidula mucida]
MPRTKNNEKNLTLPEYLVANHLKSHVFCTLCHGPGVPPFDKSSREWVLADKSDRHLWSKGHIKAAAQAQADAIEEESRVAAQRKNEAKRQRLDAHIAASTRFTGQRGLSASNNGINQRAENAPCQEIEHIFNSYSYNECDFVFDTAKRNETSYKQKLQQAIDEFGL